MKNKVYVGVDVGGTKISTGLVDDFGKILIRKKYPTSSGCKPVKIYNQIKQIIQETLDICKTPNLELLGIGLGIPGVVKPDKENILVTPNIDLSNYPLSQKLNKVFKVKVVLGNDVNLGLFAEKWVGAGKNVNNIIGLFPGTGVGGGLIIDGKLYIGSQGAAGELGHMIIDQDSPCVNAGVYGSVEALASRQAITREIRNAVERGEQTVVTQLTNGDLSVIKSKVIAQALKQKDKVVLKIVKNVCTVLGKTCISLRHILNPDMIILGGGVIEACGDYIIPKVRIISESDPFFKDVDNCDIVQSQLGDDAVILGAVALVKQEKEGRLLSNVSYYPVLQKEKPDNILIDGKVQKGCFYIRADSKIKDFGKGAFKKDSNIIDVDILKLICKKNPSMLIVGSLNKDIAISKDGRKYLQDESIKYKIMATGKAISIYNKSSLRRAIYFC